MNNDVVVISGGAKVDGIGIAVSELLSKSYKVVMTGANQKEVDDGIALYERQKC